MTNAAHHTIDPAPEVDWDAALRDYWEATRRVTAVSESYLAALVLATWPNAASLEATGAYNEDGQINLRAERVRDAAGNALAGFYADGGYIGGEEAEHTWDDATSRIDDVLDFIAQINGEDYLFTHVFEWPSKENR